MLSIGYGLSPWVVRGCAQRGCVHAFGICQVGTLLMDQAPLLMKQWESGRSGHATGYYIVEVSSI